MIIWFIYYILYIHRKCSPFKSFFYSKKHNFDCLQLVCFGHPIFLFTKRQQSFIPSYYITSIELKFYNQQQNGEMSLHRNHISYHIILEQQLPLTIYKYVLEADIFGSGICSLHPRLWSYMLMMMHIRCRSIHWLKLQNTASKGLIPKYFGSFKKRI